MTPTVHSCRVLWRGPGQPPVCVAPDHWFAPAVAPAPVRLGDIGPVRRRVDLEPMPESVPVHEPSPVVVPERQPERQPVPVGAVA